METHLFSHRQHNSFSLRKTSTNILKFLDFSIPGSPRDNKNASVTIDDIKEHIYNDNSGDEKCENNGDDKEEIT